MNLNADRAVARVSKWKVMISSSFLEHLHLKLREFLLPMLSITSDRPAHAMGELTRSGHAPAAAEPCLSGAATYGHGEGRALSNSRVYFACR